VNVETFSSKSFIVEVNYYYSITAVPERHKWRSRHLESVKVPSGIHLLTLDGFRAASTSIWLPYGFHTEVEAARNPSGVSKCIPDGTLMASIWRFCHLCRSGKENIQKRRQVRGFIPRRISRSAIPLAYKRFWLLYLFSNYSVHFKLNIRCKVGAKNRDLELIFFNLLEFQNKNLWKISGYGPACIFSYTGAYPGRRINKKIIIKQNFFLKWKLIHLKCNSFE